MKKILIAIDMQNDFISGSLGSEEAELVAERAAKYIKDFEGEIFITKDTHKTNYLLSLEGKKLPVEHCIDNTWGHILDERIQAALGNKIVNVVYKETFGDLDFWRRIKFDNVDKEEIQFEILGLCTDVCVISNAIILRAAFPNSIIKVHEDMCAGTSKEAHAAAIMVMQSVQCDII